MDPTAAGAAMSRLLLPTIALLVMILVLVGSIRALRRTVHPTKRRQSKARREIERILEKKVGNRQ